MTVFWVEDSQRCYRHGPFSSRRSAEQFAIALAPNSKGAILILSDTIDIDDDGENDRDD